MEKTSKKIVVLAVSLVALIGIVAFLISLNQKGKGSQQQNDDIGQSISLNAGESTPQEVISKIDESISIAQGNEVSKDEVPESSQEMSTEESSTEESRESSTEESSSEEQTQESTTETESESTTDSTEQSAAQSTEQSETESKAKQEKDTAVNVGTGSSPDERVIDFAGLQAKKNAHIYAWISVPGTNIDYPVLRHPTDDGYYLYHNLNGSSGYPGCIYTENWNSKDWTDPVTVLYGHDMRSTGTMFHQLHKFEKQDFFDKNQYIYIYTPEKTLKYQIFAAYVHTNEHLLYNHNFSNTDVFDSFFNTVLSSAGGVNHVRDGVSISSGSKIIALSTCIKNKPDNRYIIFGVLQ